MIKTWTYKGIEYKSECRVRQEIFEHEHVCFGNAPLEGKVKFWARYGVTYAETEGVKHVNAIIQPEQLASEARATRDRLLAESDFYLMQDYPIMERTLAEVKEYRKKLRDITEQEGFPSDITWPEKPAELYKQPKKALYSHGGSDA